jgi:nitrate/nitrite transporter NarK
MNQTFDVQRFLLLIKLNLAEKGKSYLLTAGLLTGLLLALQLPVIWGQTFDAEWLILHVMALVGVVFLGGGFFTGSVFSQYGSASTGIVTTMIPGSMLEKFLSALFINLCLYVSLMIIFVALHKYTIDLANSRLIESDLIKGYLPRKGSLYKSFGEPMLWYFSSVYMISHGAFILGSIYFAKHPQLKTAFIL